MNDVKRVSVIGIIFNILLLIMKFGISMFSKSQAMLADSLHSAEDVLASVLSYIGAKITSTPRDSNHPYGHGKAEYVFSLVIAITMVLAAFSMLKSSVLSIISSNDITFSVWLIIICIVTIITKFFLYIYTNIKYKKNNYILIRASKEDHRNDMFLTSGTLIGVTCGYFGIYIVDSVVGILIGIWILYIGIRLFIDSYKVLIDTSIDNEKIDKIKNIINEEEHILNIDSIQAKPVGMKYLIVIKIAIDKESTVESGYIIAKNIKENLIINLDFVYDTIIHINPYSKTNQ